MDFEVDVIGKPRSARSNAPVPTALKRLRGNPGHQRIRTDEPTPPVGLPTAPRHLSASARREYRRVGLQLVRAGVMTVIDGPMLAAYADAWSNWADLTAKLNEAGHLIRGRDGLPAASPLVKLQADAWARTVTAARELGLSPVARSKVVKAADTGAPTDIWSEVVG